MQALILAGQRNRGRLAKASTASFESDIMIHGRPMVDYVIDAIGGHPAITAVRVIGPTGNQPDVEYREAGESLWENIERGVDGFDPDIPILIASSDIPLLTVPVVDDFLREAPTGLDVVYPVVPKTVVEAYWPGVRRTYIRMREGVFTGGNLFLIKPRAVVRAGSHARRLLAHRKSPIRLARDIGLALLFKFVTGLLSLSDAERAGGRLLAIKGRALIFPYPEVGIDVDKPEDLDMVVRSLGIAMERGEGHA